MTKEIKRLRKYLEKKKLMLNIRKSKIVVFKKGGIKKKYTWEWGMNIYRRSRNESIWVRGSGSTTVRKSI